VRFWDSSALVPLLLEQASSPRVRELLAEDPAIAVWWTTPVECWSAVGRLRREGRLTEVQEESAARRLRLFLDGWSEVLPSEALREQARRLVRIHPLRTGDALQLAAALACAGSPPQGTLVTLDERLGSVARLEGLEVAGAGPSSAGA
jgi:predicted nucleic acid-binding protein